MNEWTPEIGKVLKTGIQPENVDRFAVVMEKEDQTVEHLNKKSSRRFEKTIFYFLRTNHGSTCKTEVRGKRVNLGNGHGLQLPCTLQFSGEEKYIKILKKKFTVLASIWQ